MARRNTAGGVSRRSSSSLFGVSVSAPDSTTWAAVRATASAAAGSPISPSASAALPFTMGAGSSRAATSPSRALLSPSKPERKRRHLPHFRIGIGEQGDERRHALPQTNAADRQRGTPAHACFAVTQQAYEIRSGRRERPCLATSRRRRRDTHHRRRRRRGVVEDPLILEPENPRQLLIEGGTCRRRCHHRRNELVRSRTPTHGTQAQLPPSKMRIFSR